MITHATFKFLKELKANNNREWFNANKPRFEEVKDEFESFIATLIPRIAAFDPAIAQLEPKKCIFRIYRDTRFSKEKTPYKTNLGAHLVAFAQKPHDRAGYYVHLEPGNVFLAGGAYMPPAPWLRAIRQSIDREGKALTKILHSAGFKKYFGEMEGEKLKTRPNDYPEEHPYIELLRYKSFLAVHPVSDKDATSENFAEHCARVFKALKPFDDFLNKSLE
ncbi:DUF2461 domain-containing protein [candidate division KSB1 bacterium]|nr:DUF2461 domain-containing protein [candidate division KSB1 bacterium]